MAGIPYCGTAPLPGAAGWNLDPVLITLLAAGALGTLAASPRRAALPLLGWAVLAAALVSPLCNLSVALFAARSGQHLLVALVAAPLLATAFARGGPIGTALPAFAFAAALWFWHAPIAYAATFAPDGIAYWAMHATLLGSATWLWAALLRGRPEGAALAGLVTAIQMGVLGALLTFAPRALYAAHADGVTLPWGLTALEDQQLGGLLMWVPGGLLLGVVLAAGMARLLKPATLALVLLMAPGLALAQGNDDTTATPGASSRAPVSVGVLTTNEVTTGASGPRTPSPAVREGADRRERVLGPVCAGLREPALAECRSKSGL
jgi:putative membrane protein